VFCALLLITVLLGFQPETASGQVHLRLATTTSTEQSGLLRTVLPPFEKRFGLKVDVIAVGSGKALKLAENGDVDVVLSHAPKLEEAFVSAGHGVNRRAVMYNDFVIVGPPTDAAGVTGAKSAAGALRRIAAAQATFVSRGDESGTHQKEKALWEVAGVKPASPWHLAAGQGMGPVLLMTNERRAYTLSDRATYLAYSQRGDLKILFQGDPVLFNPYTVIAVNPARHRHAKYTETMQLIAWLTSVEGQQLIGNFERDGEVLFHAVAVLEQGSAVAPGAHVDR
jgi:tungstate transport system substrate-binding protein